MSPRPGGQSGQALLGIIIIAALVGIVGVSVMNVVGHLANEAIFAEAKDGQNRLRQDLGIALQSQDVCRAILKVSALPGAVQIQWPTATLTAGTELPAYRVRVDGLSLINVVRVGQLTPTRELFTADLELQSKSSRSEFGYKPVVISNVFLDMEDGHLRNCYSQSEVKRLAPDLCAAFGATFVKGRCLFPVKLTDIHCPDGQYMQSFNMQGQMTCKALPDVVGVAHATPTIESTPTDSSKPGHWTVGPISVFRGITPCPVPEAQILSTTCTPKGSTCGYLRGSIMTSLMQANYTCQ